MIKQCCVCGCTANNTQYAFYNFQTLLQQYQVGYPDICESCGHVADSFVNYYGLKKPEDKARLHRFLVSGVLPMRDYSMLTNAGYY